MRWPLPALWLLSFAVACASSEDVSDDLNGNANPQPSGGSCVDSCGKQSANGSCWCDATCNETGDCCSDLATACGFPSGIGGSGGMPNPGGGGTGALGGSSFGGSPSTGGYPGTGGYPSTGGAPSAASCAGHCGSSAPGEVCWCDPECVEAGNCCPDYASMCGGGGGGLPSSGGCTTQLCNTKNPALENGVDCYCNVDCFEYGDCCTNAETVCGI